MGSMRVEGQPVRNTPFGRVFVRNMVNGSDDGDRGLAARAASGDVAAFEDLVNKHSASVEKVAARVLGGEDARDACQEVWVRAWRSLKGYRGESAFGTWIFRIATNTCLSIRRKNTRRSAREAGDPYQVHEPTEPRGGDTDPEASALGAERRGEVRAALGRVREEHRSAMVLRHVQGLSYAEIGLALGVPDGTAKGWASRGRSAMLLALRDGRPNGRPNGRPDGHPAPRENGKGT